MRRSNIFLLVVFFLLMIGFVGGMETSDEMGIPLLGALLSLAAMGMTVIKIRDDEEEDQ